PPRAPDDAAWGTVGRNAGGAGAGLEIVAAGATAEAWAAARRTSSSRMRPCGPLPRIAPRFTFSSFARRRTAGAARASPEEGGGAGGTEARVGAGGGADDAGRAAG